MDPRPRRRASSDRFLSPFSLSPPSPDGGAELHEDDVFFGVSSFPDSPLPSSPPPLSLPRPPPKSFPPESFGILAALPESVSEPRSVFPHKPVVSSSRMIPRPSMERQRQMKYNQSAPVNVPMWKWKEGRNPIGLGSEEEKEEDGEMLPPHEIVARQMERSLALSSSVLEGAGRTLKGRDLRQVRNAVFRQTGFID